MNYSHNQWNIHSIILFLGKKYNPNLPFWKLLSPIKLGIKTNIFYIQYYNVKSFHNENKSTGKVMTAKITLLI